MEKARLPIPWVYALLAAAIALGIWSGMNTARLAALEKQVGELKQLWLDEHKSGGT